MRINLNDFPWHYLDAVPQAPLVDDVPPAGDAPDLVPVLDPKPAAIVAEPKETHMNWLKIFSLIPYIAAGVQVVHADLDGPGKVQAAQDALAIATAASATVLSTDNAAKATAISALASTTLAGLVTALHAQEQPQVPA